MRVGRAGALAADSVMLDAFREVVVVDFEFTALPGERPGPICLVAHELRSGRRFRLWHNQLGPAPPYATGPDVLFVAFYASAELGCYRMLGWPMPERVLDLFVEFRDRTNGLPTPAGSSLLGALTYFGLDAMGVAEKREMQEAIGSGTWRGRFTPEEIVDYCGMDIEALARLLFVMLPRLDLSRALLRGRYMAAAAVMEHNGTPIDVEMLGRLRHGWTSLQDQLIAAVDADYGVYDGRTFKAERFGNWLAAEGIPWPRLESGELELSDGAFRQQSKAYPQVSALRELRSSLADLRLSDLSVGKDGRNRTILSAFRSRTGRNQPSNTKFIFGPSVWLRGLIKPPPGHAVAYVDWQQQEFGIAAALSGDTAMQAAYQSGDPYLAFAKQAGAVPSDATKATHGGQRELFKQCVLAVQYGMEADGLASRIGQPPIVSRNLLWAHRETYRTFWRWSDAALDSAMLTDSLHTVFGWHVHIGAAPNPRSLRNFPMQANGADMMRLAACLATERGIEVCAPVHDAFLICAALDRLDADIAAMRAAMAEASRVVLGGFELGTDVSVTRWPARYMDGRGRVMWRRVTELLNLADLRQTA
jgi:DNA polymerase I